MLRYLLDTNIVIYVLKRRPVEVLSTFNPKSGSYPAAVSRAEGSHGGSGRVILRTT